MKLTTFVRLSILIGTAGLCSYGLAGPASSSGPAQPDSGLGGVMAPVVQLPSGVSPGFAARDSVASQSTAGTQSTAANASANGSSTTTYTLGIGVMDATNTGTSSGLLIDNIQVISVPEPTTIGFSVAGAALLVALRKRTKRTS